MTAIVTVDIGDITGITWDEGCTFCTDATCAPNTYDFAGELYPAGPKACYLDDTECANGASVSEVCPLSVYVVWTGTDADGDYLTSSEMRFSNFKGYSLTNFAENARKKYEDVRSYTDYEVDQTTGT